MLRILAPQEDYNADAGGRLSDIDSRITKVAAAPALPDMVAIEANASNGWPANGALIAARMARHAGAHDPPAGAKSAAGAGIGRTPTRYGRLPCRYSFIAILAAFRAPGPENGVTAGPPPATPAGANAPIHPHDAIMPFWQL
ncbi:hypothetical protein [Ancylobacter defluvii]|uniref:Uncharacterized protein n=1 Tax=Ancylobacter defluvii TaxID=1282440 RepID=A0A9W6NA11_9HYPH|nr:hypothetical protein [Ancylobacter defluvii]MBS7589869.1 hypothetical protein [Ancylobacter defluvii]GLK82991.1 hypothetical protein GCM10017653_10600 [Ancylobacter defluvii]